MLINTKAYSELLDEVTSLLVAKKRGAWAFGEALIAYHERDGTLANLIEAYMALENVPRRQLDRLDKKLERFFDRRGE